MKKSIIFLWVFIILGCKQKYNENYCFNYYTKQTIYIQPYEDFTINETNKLLPDIKKYFDYWLYGNWDFKVLKPIPLPKNSKLSDYNKYEAIKILNYQNARIKNNEIIIGLTHKDICTDIHNIKHYGILGLSYSPGNVCIISDKRINNKSLIWKTILHEFIHAYYGAKHCPKDDPTCFMVDTKGKGDLAIQNKLCNFCNCYK